MAPELLAHATKNVSDILTHAIEHTRAQRALVVYDTDVGLTNILTHAYRAALPDALFLDFATVTKADILAAFDSLCPNDCVVLIQSTSFRLDNFRIRLHLFEKGLKVIEHTHLVRNTEETWGTYIDALAYDPVWYRTVGPALRDKLMATRELTIRGTGTLLTVTGGLETPRLNIGDYAGMKNIGGSFPIGEVFTEARDFACMNGSVMLYAFAGPDYRIALYEPFRVDIEAGLVVGWDTEAPTAFAQVIASIRELERPLVREIGFGLNRAITREHLVHDIGAFERTLGLHLSIGEKHSVYKKPGITSDKCRFHVDVFPAVDTVTVDGTIIFEHGRYTVT